MTYLIIGVLFFVMGYKTNEQIYLFRMIRDKKFIENVVNKLFEVEKND